MKKGIAALMFFVIFLAFAPTTRADAEGDLRVGLGAFKDGFFELASKELWSFVESSAGDPRLLDLYSILAQIETERENWELAQKAHAGVVTLGGERGRKSLYRLGEISAHLGDAAGARSRLVRYLNTGDNRFRADAHYLLATVEEGAGDFSKAATALADFLKAATRDDTRYPVALTRRVELLEKVGDDARTVAEARAALGNIVLTREPKLAERVAVVGIRSAAKVSDFESEGLFWASVSEYATDPELKHRALLSLSLALEKGGKIGEAAKVLDRFIASAPPPQFRAEGLGEAARLALNRGESAKALDYVEKALALGETRYISENARNIFSMAMNAALLLNRENAALGYAIKLEESGATLTPDEEGAVNFLLAGEAEEQGASTRALTRYLAVPATSYYHSQALLRGALLMVEQGQPERVLELLAPALEGDDPLGNIRLVALSAANKIGDLVKAHTIVESLLADLPEGVEEPMLLEQKAALLEARGKYDGAKAARLELLDRFASSEEGGRAALELMVTAHNATRYDEVLALEERAVEADPDRVAFMAGEALMERGRTDEAIARYEALAKKGGDYGAMSAIRVGEVAQEGGDAARAVVFYERALELGLDEELNLMVKGRIEALSDE